MKIKRFRTVELAFGSAIIVLLMVGALSYRNIAASGQSVRMVRHTHEVLDNLRDLRFAMESISSAIRRFILTEEEAAVGIYRAARVDVERHVAALRALMADNPEQQARLPILERLSAERSERADLIIGVRRSQGTAAAVDLVRTGPSLAVSNQFRTIIQEMQTEELRLLALRERAAQQNFDGTSGIMMVGTLFGLLVTGAAGWIVQRDTARRKAAEDALFEEKERAEVTLNSIGDAVACIDTAGNITYLNAVAERMTGWSLREAAGRPMPEVLKIIDGASRETIPNPMEMAIQQNRSIHLPDNCVLISRDGLETPIEDSVAPIHDRLGLATGAVIVFRDVTLARTMALQMAYAAEHDFLTGLPNRMLLHDRITQAIALAPRHTRKVAVLFLDLDGFKSVNDSLGHGIGDKLLQSVGKRLVDCVRGSDTVSRQGGDEFVVLLSEVQQLEDAAITARRMLRAVAEVHHIDGHDLHLTTSIGVSVYPDDGLDATTLIKNADTAMYQAKENKRQGYRFFRPSMHGRAPERQVLEQNLREALERQEFSLHYQPKIDLRTGVICGAEALIRWRHPTRGTIGAGEFIPIAEDCGLMRPIGAWVLREACAQARAWIDGGLPLATMAVNVSASEFAHEQFLPGLFATLNETGLDPRYLELEMTEGALVGAADGAAHMLKSLRAGGVRAAIDDYGTGSSGLSFMRTLAVDAIKIDPSLVRQLGMAGTDTTVVATIIGMARSLKLRVVAEGVETVEELHFLRAQQCDEAQGYYFSRPVEPRQFATLLQAGRIAAPAAA